MILIFGAGIYGLYAALYLGKRLQTKNQSVIVCEYDSEAFKRATYVNQARVHMGYHYPRSISTAMKSAHYFNRFMEDFGFSVLTDFKQIYAVSRDFSWTNSDEFVKFCKNASIECVSLDPDQYFKNDMCDGAFLTHEYTYDAKILRDYLLSEIEKLDNIKIFYDVRLKQAETNKNSDAFRIATNKGIFDANFVLNATYASTNQISQYFGFEPFKIKYELCEIILCNVNDALKNIGFTVMDGPFFSIMPFGKTGLHSLTSVTFTPHITSYDKLPKFECQKGAYCSPSQLGNCNNCKWQPKTAWPYMSNLAKKFLRDEFEFSYLSSLYSIKPILMASEIDDSRPTVIRQYSKNPTFISVLSGKINTVYDFDEYLDEALRY